MNDMEDAFENLKDEVKDKVAEAVRLLKEASKLAASKSMYPSSLGEWDELKEIVSEFIELPEPQYRLRGWSASGCSF